MLLLLFVHQGLLLDVISSGWLLIPSSQYTMLQNASVIAGTQVCTIFGDRVAPHARCNEKGATCNNVFDGVQLFAAPASLTLQQNVSIPVLNIADSDVSVTVQTVEFAIKSAMYAVANQTTCMRSISVHVLTVYFVVAWNSSTLAIAGVVESPLTLPVGIAPPSSMASIPTPQPNAGYVSATAGANQTLVSSTWSALVVVKPSSPVLKYADCYCVPFH
jgi:hypothetical protein